MPRSSQFQVEEFLKSLAAPPSAEFATAAGAEGHPNGRRSLLGPASPSTAAGKSAASTPADAGNRAEQEQRAAARLKMAQALESMDKPQGALVFYREILREDPDSAAARTAAAQIKALGGEKKAPKAR